MPSFESTQFTTSAECEIELVYPDDIIELGPNEQAIPEDLSDAWFCDPSGPIATPDFTGPIVIMHTRA